MGKKDNFIVIDHEASIGESSAENDNMFLFECFEDHPMLAVISEVNNSKSFLTGRTGDGKTATLRMLLKNNPDNSSEINLLNMSLDYVSNSDILKFVSELEVDLSLFFQTLWKHVLIIEYIKIKYKINSSKKSHNWLDSFANFFKKDPQQKRAIAYLEKWSGKFWITMDENVKEITDIYRSELQAELGAELEASKAKVGFTRNLSKEKKANISHRAKKILDSNLLSELNKVMTALKKYNSSTNHKPLYILIDGIDERWVDEKIRFHLIRALIDTLKSFGRIIDLKVVVAIRVDVLERVVNETRDLGFQRDKFEDQAYRIHWGKERLKSIVNKRIKLMCRRKYTKENITFEDIFPNKVNGKNPFDYIIERSFLRPRDVINFVNKCLLDSEGHHEVTANSIKSAERIYSNLMVDSIISEWASILPSLDIILKMISGRGSFSELCNLINEDFILNLYIQMEANEEKREDVLRECLKNYFEDANNVNYLIACKTIASELYRVGVFGIKLNTSDRFRFSFKDEPQLPPSSIHAMSRIQIHSAFHIALNINPTIR